MNDVLNFTYRNIILLCNKSKKIIARKVLREYYPYSQISFENEKNKTWPNFIKNKPTNWMSNILYHEFIIYFIKMSRRWNVTKFTINAPFCIKLNKKTLIKISESRGSTRSHVYITYFFLKCNYCHIVQKFLPNREI